MHSSTSFFSNNDITIMDRCDNKYLVQFSKNQKIWYYRFIMIITTPTSTDIRITDNHYKKLQKSYFKHFVERSRPFITLRVLHQERYFAAIERYNRKKKLEKLLGA